MHVAGLSPTLTGCFRLEMRTAGKRFSLYQGPVDLFRLEIGKEKSLRSWNQLTISLSTQSSIMF